MTSTTSMFMGSSLLPSSDLATPLTISAIRIAGKVSCTSAIRMITLSTVPPT